MSRSLLAHCLSSSRMIFSATAANKYDMADFFIHFLSLYLKKVYICANDEHTSGYAVIMHGFAVGWYYR